MQNVRDRNGSEEPQKREAVSPGLAQAAWVTLTGFTLFYRFYFFWNLFLLLGKVSGFSTCKAIKIFHCILSELMHTTFFHKSCRYQHIGWTRETSQKYMLLQIN